MYYSSYNNHQIKTHS